MALNRARRLAPAVATVAVVLLLAAPGAAAHGGAAVFTSLEATETAPGELEVRVAVIYDSDGHPAESAIVEVSATGPDGAAVPAQEAVRQDEPGVYLATLAVPEAGTWTVSVTSAFPPGSDELPVAVSFVEPSAGEPGTQTTMAGPEVPTATAAAQDDAPTPVEEDETAGDITLNWVVAIVGGVIGGALGLWVSNRRSRRRQAEARGG